MSREIRSVRIQTKIGTFGELTVKINSSDFHDNWRKGLDFTGARKTYVPIGNASRI
jgi:hypothetical protein